MARVPSSSPKVVQYTLAGVEDVQRLQLSLAPQPLPRELHLEHSVLRDPHSPPLISLSSPANKIQLQQSTVESQISLIN